MNGQEENHSQYIQAVYPNVGYTETYNGGGITWKDKLETFRFVPIKSGIDKKATHLWNKRNY